MAPANSFLACLPGMLSGNEESGALMNENVRNSPSRWGHGLFPVAERDWQARREAVLELSGALGSRITPEWTDNLASAISEMVRAFNHICRQTSRDWFIMSGLFSHPSPRLSGRLADGLSALLDELEEDHIAGINAALERLESLFLPQMLEGYSSATRPSNPVPLKEPSGWAFMLYSEAEPLAVLAGATRGGIREVVADAARANPGLPSPGIAAAWRVTDSAAASAVVSSELGHRVVASGYHSFSSREDLVGAKRDLYRALADRNLVVGNPLWEPPKTKPLMEVDPYSHDISNKRFTVDVEGVFDAFRR